MLSPLRIVVDAAAYRLKRHEAGNLVTSMTLAVALALPFGEIAYRFCFGALLNLWVYLVNDCFDIDIDLGAPGRDHERTRYLADHRTSAWLTTLGLFAALLGMAAAHGRDLLVVLLTTAVIIVGYSRVLKHHPIVDLVAMAGWGVSMAWLGTPLDCRAGLWLAGLLGVLCMVTEAVQVLRDLPSDRAAGVRTTAVLLGERGTQLVARILIVIAATYAVLLLHRVVGAALLLALFVPLSAAKAIRAWDLLRVTFGLVWLGLLASYRYQGNLYGWIG
jgi:4-hydroxybenzoate polyprenyltransferase